MQATVIGADGGMGQWLTGHLTNLGYSVTGFDERKGDNPSTLAEADLVVVSVPVGATATVIRSALKHMRRDATIMEIASLKTEIHEEMVKASAQGFNALCVHPMFGPTATSLKDKTVAVVTVSDPESEKKQAEALFPEASIVPVEAECHD
ncbi:MAG: prephenate dehydrogenase/arogenate dehydrogenase family protein [bacterium]